MLSAFERLQQSLKRLPGLGYRSAERLALHLLVEKPESGTELIELLKEAVNSVHACPACGNLCEGERCDICSDTSRNPDLLCVVETVPDLRSMERAGAYRGRYHVLQGKLSPIHGVGPEHLNLESLKSRLEADGFKEVILALSNDIEGEATCHYLQEEIFSPLQIPVSRIGFGLPSGGGIPYADATTLRSALDGRRSYD
ncbi:recombination protein RecR [Puniceicoccales bacterium CK1056]|uniref:Recombination protein RecR n=1 Tax=Oceanipulchritudo coccoides TaxID=2706888 RepID=A0A6B2M5N6_9BACT|nr:recombination mediator RecR [Oceanipulchritudo coccoides]NDV63105.1 recombination protein RecR [Oceanipulchritudo coccoides]